ncbi:hypothetical protein WJX72_012183 [[Myrmecia] bisecta]|uniref:TOG domain-containing protein n=1 Tax=[Myrmecia] bisecta TaxID=41462 RepID=A0AAW1PHC3_9CHLO
MSEWEDLLELFGGDSRQRLQGLENLQAYLDANQLSRHQAAELTDAMCWLLKDNNFKVCQHTLQVLTAFVSQQGSHLKSHANALVPAVVEKLGDMKQAVRITAGQALLGLLSTLGAAVVLERARAAWAHKNWRVRHGMVQSVTEALVQLGAGLLAQRERDELVLQPVVTLLDDSNSHVRDAAVECLEEMYRQLGDHVIDALNQCNIRATQLKEIHTRFQQVAAGHISLRSHALNSPRASETSSVLSASGHSEESDTTPRSCPASPRTLESRGSDRLDKSGSAELSTSGRSNGSTAQHSTRPAGRRGGFKDSGGMTADGELPAVTPILVDSERELKQEIQKLITAMDVKVDWTKRIEAMLRLEALVLGGAGAWDCFFELLKPLRDPITVQLEDRRSAVSRQACHLLGVLAAALGGRFEMHAIYYIPVLFKVLVITVQIMADSADLGMRTLLHHCRSPRLLPRLCDAICTDRSAKLRQSCAEYLLQVVEEWEPSTYERCLDAMENAIRSACQDALSDVRAIGRTAFAAYARIWPERGHAFMRRMDGGLQERLTAAMAVYVPGAYSQQVEAAAAAAQPAVKLPPRRQSSLPSMPNGISSSSQASRPVTPAYPAHAAQSAGTHAAAAAQAPARHDAARPGTGKERRGMRKSIGGAALRIVMHEAQAEEAMDAAAGPAHEMPTAVRRVSSASALLPATAARMRPPTAPARTSELSRPKRVAAVAERASRAGEEEQASTSSRSWPEDETPQATLAAVLAMAHSAGSEWKAKVDVFVALRQLLIDQAPTAAAEIGIHLDRLLVLFLEHIGDAHHKVAAAALEALGEALRCGGRLWEGSLDRLLPPLFLRTFDAKEALRKASLDALAAVPAAIPIEALLPALTKSLEAMRSPKGRLAVMDFFCAYAGAGEFVAHALAGGSSHTLRVWVARVASLLGDKNPDLRKAAAITLEAVHQRLDRTAIPAYMHSAGPTEQLALRRALSPAILDADEHAQGINTRWGATPAPVRPSPFLVLTPPSASRSKLSFEDSATSEQYLAACIEQLHSAPSYELMRAFTQLVSAVPGDVWQRHIIPAVSGLLSVVATHADDMTCESALLVLRDLALHHGTLWEPLLGLALPQMLEACCQPTREVCMAADEALVAVVAHTPAQRCLQAALAALQPSLLPRLFEAFKHPSADVRKAVVFCLVDIWMALGEALTPLLASLSTSQLKLLTIYVNRAQAKQQQQPNGSMTSAQRSAAPQAVSGC